MELAQELSAVRQRIALEVDSQRGFPKSSRGKQRPASAHAPIPKIEGNEVRRALQEMERRLLNAE